MLTFNLISQSKDKPVLGLSFGSLMISDATHFQNNDLSKFPDRPFIKVGVGAKFYNNVVITTEVVTDLWYINTTIFIPLFAISPSQFQFKSKCNYALINNRQK